MPRKLKTYTTSAGFFDLAVAAPSMKAALEAWGSKNNLFHQGFAKASDDPEVIKATMAKPGVVLRRPVGTGAAFTEHATLPRNFANVVERPAKKQVKAKQPPAGIDDRMAREAAAQYEREQKQREREASREEAARKKERARRDHAIAVAEQALEAATRAHKEKATDLEKARASLDRKVEAENERWAEQKEHLEAALERARTRD